MPSYSYIARNSLGRILRGHLEAPTPVHLRARLNAMQLQLVSLQVAPGRLGLQQLQLLNPQRWLPPRSRDMELVLHQLSIMLRSGIKLLDALKALQMQAVRPTMNRLLGCVHDDVARGSSLSDAMSKHSIIPAVVLQLVQVGEQTGSLDAVLTKSHLFMSNRRKTITEVRIAFAYPAVVTVAALSIAAYLIVFVIPQLQTFLSAMGRQLPAMTQTLVDFGNWLSIYGSTLVLAFTAAAAALATTYYSQRGRLWLDRRMLNLPVVGNILQLSGTASLASSLSIMLHSGIRLVEALKVADRLQNNRHLAGLLRSAAKTVSSGKPLTPALAAGGGFSPILGTMVEVAERSGNLEGTLNEVATYCDSELKVRIKRMTQMIEPVVIVVAGGIVAYVYIAFFIGLMSAGGNLK